MDTGLYEHALVILDDHLFSPLQCGVPGALGMITDAIPAFA